MTANETKGDGMSMETTGSSQELSAKCMPARVANDNEHINYRTLCGVEGETAGCGWMDGSMHLRRGG